MKRRRMIRGAEIRALGGIDQCRGVAHAAGEEPVDGHAGPPLAGRWPVGQACPGRFEPEEAARRSRDAHRTAPVAAMGNRYDPSRHCGSGPGRRSTGNVADVPRIACRSAVGGSFGSWPNAELGAGRAGEGDQSAALQPGEQLGIDGVAVVAVQARPHARRKVDGFAAEVLDQEGNPAERALRQAGGDGPAGPIDLHRHHGGDLLVGVGRARQRSVEQLAGRDLLGAHQSGQVSGIVTAVFVVAHGRPT